MVEIQMKEIDFSWMNARNFRLVLLIDEQSDDWVTIFLFDVIFVGFVSISILWEITTYVLALYCRLYRSQPLNCSLARHLLGNYLLSLISFYLICFEQDKTIRNNKHQLCNQSRCRLHSSKKSILFTYTYSWQN